MRSAEIRRAPLFVSIVAASALIVGACGSAASPDGGGGGSSPGASSQPSSGGGAIPSITIGGGSLPAGFEQRLVPPDSQIAGTLSVPEGTLVNFTSTKSVDELKQFYVSAIQALGGQDVVNFSAGGGVTLGWSDDSSSKGGLIIIAPQDGGGTTVAVTYGGSS